MNMIEDAMEHAMTMSPRKPSFIGYTVPTHELFQGIVDMIEAAVGFRIGDYCTPSFADEGDREFYFVIDEYELEEQLTEDEYSILQDYVGDSLEEYYNYTTFLVKRWLGIQGTHNWVYAQGNYDEAHVEIQVGVPQ